jgi:hypothetical protein
MVWQTSQAGFVQKLPKKPSKRKPASRTSPPLNKNSHSTTGTSLLRNYSRQSRRLNRSDRFGKPVRLVLALIVGKNSIRGKNSNLPPIDLPIRSTDQSETLRIDGVPRAYPCLEARSPKPTQSRGTESQPSRTPSKGNHRKHPNRSRFGGFVGSRSPSKEAQGPHT